MVECIGTESLFNWGPSYSHRQPKSNYYLVWTIPFLGISKVARKFPNCRNCKLIKCRRDWHEQISLNWHFNGFLLQNFGQPPKQFRKNTEICAINSFLQANYDPVQKKEFLWVVPEIISLQNWLKMGTFQCQN